MMIAVRMCFCVVLSWRGKMRCVPGLALGPPFGVAVIFLTGSVAMVVHWISSYRADAVVSCAVRVVWG